MTLNCTDIETIPVGVQFARKPGIRIQCNHGVSRCSQRRALCIQCPHKATCIPEDGDKLNEPGDGAKPDKPCSIGKLRKGSFPALQSPAIEK